MYRNRLVWLLLLPILLVGILAFAQDSTTEVNPDANLSWPPPVYLLRGEVELRGTANVEGMRNYFVEFRTFDLERLADALATPEPDSDEAQWFPAVFGQVPVIDDVLGTWDTTSIEDGVYELRLRVNLAEGTDPVIAELAPIRIENNPPDFVVINPGNPSVRPTQPLPTLLPTPTNLPGGGGRATVVPTQPGSTAGGPSVRARIDANVRSGDSTLFPIVGNLGTGESAQVIGLSTTGSRWYYIQLPDGRRGWIAPSTVDTSGDFTGLPRISPPAPPTPTPVPATATPTSQIDLLINGHEFVGLACNGSGSTTIRSNITNTGSAASPGGSVAYTVQRLNDSITVVNAAAGFTQVGANGGNFLTQVVVTLPAPPNATFTSYRLIITVDAANVVAETNESNNVYTVDFTCP